jgi:hypothetical protein
MALGDGIRRNVAEITQAERDLLRDAFLTLDTTKLYPDGVTYWDKQEQVHVAAHFAGADVHSGPAFLAWHRELCNRLEALLREVNPGLSLHYWDWTTDPRATPDGTGGTLNLFTSQFMGSSSGDAGPPFQDFESTEGGGHTHIWRNLAAGAPTNPSDNTIVTSGDGQPQSQEWPAMEAVLHGAHDYTHSSYIRGTIGDAHFSFHDPFVFLLHSNVDRLWAMWQRSHGQWWRLDPNLTYGTDGAAPSINTAMEPWAGITASLRPWAPPENEQISKTSKDMTVVIPPFYDSLPTTVEVANPPGSAINFNDVPDGETTLRAAVFRVFSISDITLTAAAPTGPYAISPLGATAVAHPKPGVAYVEKRIWFQFTGSGAGTTATPGSVTIHCAETGQSFVFTLTGNTIARPTVAVMLTLDQSGSMDDPAGTTGLKRIDVIHSAAQHFAQLAQPNNGIGVVRFDTTAYPVADPTYPGLAVTKIGTGGLLDPGRTQIVNAVLAHHTNPAGMTSIGAGVQEARSTLTPVTGYDDKAMIVFTDGLENTPPMIADVLPSIDTRTFAIGLGNEQQVSTAALHALANSTGGYLLLTGLLTGGTDDYFRVSKYFLQILAGVTNTNVVVDPSGSIAPGTTVRIPFVLNDADIDATVILLTDIPAVHLAVETPSGDVMDAGAAAGVGADYENAGTLVSFRYPLPLALGAAGAQEGTWHALLTVKRPELRRYLAKLAKEQPRLAELAQQHGPRYSLVVHSFSNLRMTARLDQDRLTPGATIWVRTLLTEYDLPVAQRATVEAQVTWPDGSTSTLPLPETDAGSFEASLTATMAGVYRFRVIADGSTLRGVQFTREQTLTGAAFPGGDNPLPTSGGDSGSERICELLKCLLGEPSVERLLKRSEINRQELTRCLERYCEKTRPLQPRS